MSGGCPVSATAGLSCCRRVSVPVPVPGLRPALEWRQASRGLVALPVASSVFALRPSPALFPLPPPPPPHPALVQCQSQFCLRAAPLPPPPRSSLPPPPLRLSSPPPPAPPHLSAAATVAPEYLPVLKKSGQCSSSFKDCPAGDSL